MVHKLVRLVPFLAIELYLLLELWMLIDVYIPSTVSKPLAEQVSFWMFLYRFGLPTFWIGKEAPVF